MAVASRALELIDMRKHKGSHPRMGAVDVVPFVPMRGMTMAEAVEIARRFGRAFAETHGIPVFFYEEACTSEARRSLSDIRKGEYEGMPRKLQDPAWIVDTGPQQLNARSGVTAVGARMPLIAFNVNLHTDDVEVAKKIANAVRHVGGGLRFVRAIGLRLEDKGIVQVSMNLLNYHKTPIHRALELIKAEAARYGVLVKVRTGGDDSYRGPGRLPAITCSSGFNSRQMIEHHLLPIELAPARRFTRLKPARLASHSRERRSRTMHLCALSWSPRVPRCSRRPAFVPPAAPPRKSTSRAKCYATRSGSPGCRFRLPGTPRG
jgi:hypothetical protein